MLHLLTEFKDKLLREGLFTSTVDGRIKAVVYFSRYMDSCNMKKVSKKDIEEYKKYFLTEHRTNKGNLLCRETVTFRLCSLREYFRFLVDNKYIFFDPTMNLKLPKKEYKFPEYIPSEKDIEEFIAKPDPYTYIGMRDRTLIELSYICPLRNKELRELTMQEVDMEKKYIYPKRAKRGRECGIPIMESTYKVIEKYLEISRPRLLRKAKVYSDRLFLTESGEPFKQGTINEIFQKYRGKKRIHPHAMRHACAIHMIKNGARIRDVQVLLGHKSIRSTQLYTRLTATDLKDLHDKYHPGERRKGVKTL